MSSFFAFTFAFILGYVLVQLTIFFAKKYGFVDNPKKRTHPAILHTRIIPRAGGLAIFLSFLIASFTFVPFSKKLLGIFLGAIVVTIVGLIDDKYDLRAWQKFLAQIVAAVLVVLSGIGITFIANPFSIFGTGIDPIIRLDVIRVAFQFFGTHSILILADLFAIFWIVWVINMVNFSSGVDGQLGGISLITLFVIFAASLRFGADPGQSIVTKLSVIGAGATLAFLINNVNPARIFPGDSGSYFLGYLIAVLAILSGAKVGTALLVMAVPLVDGVFTVLRRIALGQSPFLGDKKHLHHRLLEMGLTQTQVSLFYWLLCAILGAIALALPAEGKVFAALFVAIIVLGVLVWLNINLQNVVRK